MAEDMQTLLAKYLVGRLPLLSEEEAEVVAREIMSILRRFSWGIVTSAAGPMGTKLTLTEKEKNDG